MACPYYKGHMFSIRIKFKVYNKLTTSLVFLKHAENLKKYVCQQIGVYLFFFIEMDEKSVIYNHSKKLQGLFDIYSNDTENETGSQFRRCNKGLLSALHIDEFLNKIQSLKEKVEIRRGNPSEDQQMKPGIVYVYDVHMVCGKNGLPIIEKVNLIFEMFNLPPFI